MTLLIKLSPPSPDVPCYDETAEATTTTSEPDDANSTNAPCQTTMDSSTPTLIIMSRNYLSKNDELRKGDFLLSNNREWKAVFQDDGNFVIYGWKPMWSSDTAGPNPHRLCMQEDCNLVIYTQEDSPMWHTNTFQTSCKMCRIHLKDDGHPCAGEGRSRHLELQRILRHEMNEVTKSEAFF
ncbi:hypothetical protein J4Q44_G00299060 [Coregonus suidteri]|uniref:Bulb-type lectin domain-containing protein n=1 Tax=Coregonus suidteri TaxID=861788 RepID=A0AAN8KXD0_9TELE